MSQNDGSKGSKKNRGKWNNQPQIIPQSTTQEPQTITTETSEEQPAEVKQTSEVKQASDSTTYVKPENIVLIEQNQSDSQTQKPSKQEQKEDEKKKYIFELASYDDSGPKACFAAVQFYAGKKKSLKPSSWDKIIEHYDPAVGLRTTDLQQVANNCLVKFLIWNSEQPLPKVIEPAQGNSVCDIDLLEERLPQPHWKIALPSSEAQLKLGKETLKKLGPFENELNEQYYYITGHSTDLQQLIDQAWLKYVQGNTNLRIDPLKNLKPVTNPQNPDEIFDILLKINDFLHSNPETFSTETIDQVLPRIIFVGDESSGKTATVSSLLGVPVGFSKAGTGTRCPCQFSLRYSTDLKADENSGHAYSGSITDRTGKVVEYRDKLDALAIATKVKDIMDRIGKDTELSEKVVDINIETSHKQMPIMCTDFPGIPGDNAGQYKNQVRYLCKKLVREWVLSRSSRSHAFVVIKCGSPWNSQNWLSIFTDDTKRSVINCDRISVVITHIDMFNAQTILRQLESDDPNKVGDELLRKWLYGDILAKLPQAKIYFLANPQTGHAYTNLQTFEKAVKDIIQESKGGDDSGSQAFIKELEGVADLAKIRGRQYLKNPEVMAEIKSHVGLAALRKQVNEISISGVASAAKFTVLFLDKCLEQLEHTAKTQKATNMVKLSASPVDVIQDLLKSSRDIFYYTMSGHNLPVNNDSGYCLPHPELWDKIKVLRSVALRDEITDTVPVFPQGLAKEVEVFLMEQFDPQKKPDFSIVSRLTRYTNVLAVRAMLLPPPTKTIPELLSMMGMVQDVQQLIATPALQTEVEIYIKKHLAQASASHMKAISKTILDQAIGTVLFTLKSMPQYKYLFHEPSHIITPQNSSAPVEIADKYKQRLEQDLKEFFEKAWRDPICDQIEKICMDITQSSSTPTVPGFMTVANGLIPHGNSDVTGKKGNPLYFEHLAHWEKLPATLTQILSTRKPDGSFDDKALQNWEQLAGVAEQKDLISLLVPPLVRQVSSDFVTPPESINKVTEADRNLVNHVLLRRVRAAIILFCCEMLTRLPAAYRSFSEPNYLGTLLDQQFFFYLQNKKGQNSKKAAKKPLDESDEFLEIFSLEETANPNTSFVNVRNPDISRDEIPKIIEEEYKITSLKETMQRIFAEYRAKAADYLEIKKALSSIT